jgi:hypothetical protein
VLDPDDTKDTFSFFVEEATVITWRLYSDSNPDGYDEIIQTYQKGTRKIQSFVTSEPQSEITYLLRAENVVSVADREQDQAINDILDILSKIMSGADINKAQLIDSIKIAATTPESITKLLTKIAKAAGPLGNILDVGLRSGEILDAPDRAEEIFVQLVDLTMSAGAMGVGAIAGSPFFGPVGALLHKSCEGFIL